MTTYIAVCTVVAVGARCRCKLAEARTQIERCCMKDDNEGCDQAERMSTDADGLIGTSDTATDAVADGTRDGKRYLQSYYAAAKRD